MKRIILLLFAFVAFTAVSFAQETGIIADVLRKCAEQKVASMQELINFDNDKAKLLKQMELQFLLDVQKAETCFLCNSKRKIEKLQSTRENELQKILSRDEYIKYHSLENDLLNENNRLWLQ